MATIYTLTINPVLLGITKPVDRVYIKNLYVDTDDTHIRTAAFEYSAEVIGATTSAQLPPTTLGSIYQIQLFGSEGMVLSVFFGMPERNTLLSELSIYTAYPPRSYYPEASISWGQLKGAIANQTDLTDIMFTKVEAALLSGTLDGLIKWGNIKGAITQQTDLNAVMFTKTEAAAMQAAIDASIATIDPKIKWGNIKGAIADQTDLMAIMFTKTAAAALKVEIDGLIKWGNIKGLMTDQTDLTNLTNSLFTKAEGQVLTDGLAATNITINTSMFTKAEVPALKTELDDKIAWGNIKGDLLAQTDLNAVMFTKAEAADLSLEVDGTIAWGNIKGLIADQLDLSALMFTKSEAQTLEDELNSRIDGAQSGGTYYNTTTTAAPNTTIAADGSLLRSTMVFGTVVDKNVGVAAGQIPLAENAFRAAHQKLDAYISTGGNANTLVQGDRVLFSAASNMAEHLGTLQVIECHAFHAVPNVFRQEAYNYDNGDMSTRLSKSAGLSAWKPITTHKSNYNTTTAAGANVAVDSTGALLRSTSSERYKDILAPLVLDDVKYASAMSLKPIVYRSTADADNPLHHYYSFSAEALGAFDPAFTLWRYTEQVTDADGNTTEQPLAEKQAEGLNINALLAMSHAIAIKQDKLIKSLTARVVALESTPAA